MKNATTSKEAIKIFKAINPRLMQLWDKLTKGNYNSATPFVFEIGFIDDIDNTLKKLKVRRTIVKQKNVKIIDIKDIEKIELLK